MLALIKGAIAHIYVNTVQLGIFLLSVPSVPLRYASGTLRER
ncbi:MAG: hypothetical protein V7K69_01230 [Nostoc sp.]